MSDNGVMAALARLEAGQTKLEAGQTKLGDEVTMMGGELTKMRGELTNMSGGQARLSDDLSSLRIAVMDRMDRLQDTVTLIKEDMVVNLGGVNTVFERQAGLRKEIDTVFTQTRSSIA